MGGEIMVPESKDYYKSLLDRLRKLPAETGWLEYKCNNTDPQIIGEYISALSNSAALAEKEKAKKIKSEHVIWQHVIVM